MTILTRRFAAAVTFAACLAGFVAPSAAEDSKRSKLDRVLRDAPPDATPQQVIVQAAPGQLAELRRRLDQLGVPVKAHHPGLEALTVVMRGQDLAALAAEPSVLVASTDAEVTAFQAVPSQTGKVPGASGATADRPGSRPSGEVGLKEALGLAQARFTGHGINIAIVDSGIDGRSDVGPNVAGFWDFTAGGVPARPTDEYGHGTHVAGLIASTGRDSGEQFAGIAPRSRLYGFKVLDAAGRGRASDVVQALEFIVANRQSVQPGALRIDIINLSIGHPIYEPAATDPLVRAVEHAVRAGIVVITSAGNIGQRQDGLPGYAGITSPGNAPSAITVGALDHRRTTSVRDDRVAPFSSRGPTWFDAHGKPDLVAPGVNLVANAPAHAALFQAYPQLMVASASGVELGRLSGTSMAAAVVTGVASVVLEASRSVASGRPGLTPNALKAVLQYTALGLVDEGGQGYDALTQGTGAVNPRGALVMARAIDTDMPLDTPWLRGRPQPQSVVDGRVEPWSQALIWAENIVWGTDALEFNREQWSTNIVWGSNIVWGTLEAANIVWGTLEAANIVWGSAVRLQNIVWGTAAGTWMGSLAADDRVIGERVDASNIVWGTLEAANIVWGTLEAANIVWGTLEAANIVWGTIVGENIVWGTLMGENIVWGTSRPQYQNIVWGTARPQYENIVWGTGRPQYQNIVWGTGWPQFENIVWGTSDAR